MDNDARLQELENQKAGLEGYLNHPVTIEFLRGIEEDQERLMRLVLHDPVINVETFLAREQALGHLRCLRVVKATLTVTLDEVKETIKELQ